MSKKYKREIKLNSSKLADLIVKEFSELECGYYSESRVLIGEYKGIQIHLTVTQDTCNFIEKSNDMTGKTGKIVKISDE